MIQVLNGGFCFKCNSEYLGRDHVCPFPQLAPQQYETPEYRAYQIKHRTSQNKKLDQMFRMLGMMQDMIRAMMLPDRPDEYDNRG